MAKQMSKNCKCHIKSKCPYLIVVAFSYSAKIISKQPNNSNKDNRLQMQTGRKQTSWPCVSEAKEVNQVLPGTNPVGGKWKCPDNVTIFIADSQNHQNHEICKIVIGDMRDCAIGFFETKKKIGHVVSLEENRTRTCRVPLSYECVNYGVPHKFSHFSE